MGPMQHPDATATPSSPVPTPPPSSAFLDSIVLVMIVRNESKILTRCLKSVSDQGIKKALLYDTSDDFQQRAPVARIGELSITWYHQDTGAVWLEGCPEGSNGFGWTRTRALDEARLAFPDAEWALLLDADHTLGGDVGALAKQIEASTYQEAFPDCIYITQRDRSLEYANIRMVRLSPARECKGRTHEVWTELGERYDAPPELVWVDDHCDGSNRSEKYVRDEALLRMDLVDDPNNERTVFYLAQTLDSMSASTEHASKIDEAIHLYGKRAGMGGYEDEAWIARYRAGQCMLRRGKWNEGVGCLFDAWTRKPDRIEPLHRIAMAYRRQNSFRAAFELAHFYNNVPKPSGLFVESWIYEYGSDELIATTAHQLGRIEDGIEACERMLSAPHTNKAKVLELASWYLPTLGGLQQSHYPPQADKRWSPSNPSFFYTENGKDQIQGLNIRLVNYDQVGGRSYVSRDSDKRIRSRNVIVTDSGACHEWTYTLKDAETNHEISGLEDVRFFGRKFTATCCEVTGEEGRPQVVIGELGERLAHATVYPVRYDGKGVYEKNWVILDVHETYMLVLYSLNPTIVLRVSFTGEVFEKTTYLEGPMAAGLWRNSTAPIVWHDGNKLMLCHDVGRREKENVYMHRWVLLDRSSYQVLKWSKPFAIAHTGIEYASGLRWRGSQLEVAFGFEDREARTVRFGADVVSLTEHM